MKKTTVEKKLKKQSKGTLMKERAELENKLKDLRIRKRMLTDERYDLRLSLQNAVKGDDDDKAAELRARIDDLDDEIEEIADNYKDILELIATIENILKTRSDRKANVGKVIGVLGLGAASLGLGYFSEEVGKLTNRSSLKSFGDSLKLLGK